MLNGQRHVKCYTHLLNRCYDLRVNEVSNYPIKHLYLYTCKFTNKSLARIESTVYRYATRLHNRYSKFTSEVERRELVVRRPHAAAPVGVFHPGGQRASILAAARAEPSLVRGVLRQQPVRLRRAVRRRGLLAEVGLRRALRQRQRRLLRQRLLGEARRPLPAASLATADWRQAKTAVRREGCGRYRGVK